MRAFVLTGYGAISDHVRLAELPDPVAGPNQIVIEIHAASLNPIDFKLVQGALKRVSDYKLPRPIGFDASGIVLSAGAGAMTFKPGDMVYARASRDTIGTFAEKIALPENLVAFKPSTISHAEAASLPLVGLTTLQGFGRVGARAGQRILIHAGSGGVGTSRSSTPDISAFTSPRRPVQRTRISSNRWAPTESLPTTARTIWSRAAATILSTTRSAVHSRSARSSW
jgi:alcohol dehydrogenase